MDILCVSSLCTVRDGYGSDDGLGERIIDGWAVYQGT